MAEGKNSEVLVDINNIQLDYGTKNNTLKALDSIDLQIRTGEFICLLGPSGCGKTSLLNIIAGYLKPTRGKALMLGEEISGPDKHRGVVFQTPTLYNWMNVKENVEFGPKMRGLNNDEIEEISNHFLRQVKLTGFEEKPVFELSGGMKQRVALARVLANYPEMILMDEPFGALDALTRLNMQSLVRNIWHTNDSTIFMITHDIEEALSLATRVILMSKRPGTIIKEYEISYTHDILNANSKYIKFDDRYYELKYEILGLIHDEE